MASQRTMASTQESDQMGTSSSQELFYGESSLQTLINAAPEDSKRASSAPVGSTPAAPPASARVVAPAGGRILGRRSETAASVGR